MAQDTSEQTQAEDLVYALAPSPGFARDGICFAARSSGMYRTDDGGVTWRLAYDSLNLQAPLLTLAVAVSPGFESDRCVFGGAPGGVVHSADGGKRWNIAVLPTPPPVVSALVVSPDFTRDGTLFAGTLEDGVFCSTDRGSHWAAWNFGLLDLSVLCIAISPDFAQDETIFIGAETGIFFSANGGRAWREVNFPTELAPVLSLAMSPNYARDGVLFAGTERCGLYCSEDRGSSWKRLGQDVIADAVNALLLSPRFPGAPDVLALLSDALLVSRDRGQSWSSWQADLPIEQGLASVAAPQGLGPGAPLLLGLVGGRALRV